VAAATPATTPAREVLPASRALALVGLLVISLIAWIFLWQSAVAMTQMTGDGMLQALAIAMMQPAAAHTYLPAAGLMWVVMMIAMMTPAVLPIVLTFWRLARGATRPSTAHGLAFTVGYLLVWSGFGLFLTLLQWGLHQAAVLHGMDLALEPQLAAWLLVAAGIYQLTPLKTSCLAHCQSPLGFLLSHWRDGLVGAVRMGYSHGLYCLGCCWALMLLMFVGGVMSVGCMALIGLFILLERLLPPRRWATYAPGLLLITWGVWSFIGAPR